MSLPRRKASYIRMFSSNLAARRLKNLVFTFLCYIAAIIGLYVLGSILWTLFKLGGHGINLQFFTERTPAPGVGAGGLMNAIYGSMMLTALGIAAAAPLGGRQVR